MAQTSTLRMEQQALEIILTRITDLQDRNSCSLVCRVFRAAERQTRQHLRLRCTRSTLEQAPTCFPEVSSLDLSSVVPKFVEFAPSPSQLQHLGTCFPYVQTLTLFSDGCPEWLNDGDAPFLRTWPHLRTIIVKEPDPCLTESYYSIGSWPALGGAEVGLGPLSLSVAHPEPGVMLKEVSLLEVGTAELRAFAEGSTAGLEKLSIDMGSRTPTSHDLDLSSLSVLSSLQELSLDSFDCYKLAPIQNPLQPFSSLTSLSLRAPMSMTQSLLHILVTATSAKRLQTLRIDWSRSRKVEPQQTFDLTSLHHLEALKHFELKKGRQLFGNAVLKSILSIVNGAPKLTVLRLYSFQHLKDDELHNRDILFDRLTMRELVEVDMDIPIADPDHMFMEGKVQKYGCKLQPIPFLWCIFAGWDTLQDLTLHVKFGKMWLSIGCPSLRKLKLVLSPDVSQLRFVGPHSTLVEVELKMREARVRKEGAHLAAMIKSLQKLTNLTRLCITAKPESIERYNSAVTKSIAALPTLKKLVIQMKVPEEVQDTDFVHSLNELQHSNRLVEVQVPFEWDPMLSKLYDRLYGH